MLRLRQWRNIRLDWDSKLIQTDHCEVVCIFWHSDCHQDNPRVHHEEVLCQWNVWDSYDDIPSARHLWSPTHALRALLHSHVLRMPRTRVDLWVSTCCQVCTYLSDGADGRVSGFRDLLLFRYLLASRRWGTFHFGSVSWPFSAHFVVLHQLRDNFPAHSSDKTLLDQNCRWRWEIWRGCLWWTSRLNRVRLGCSNQVK